jgi:hypothetical protein
VTRLGLIVGMLLAPLALGQPTTYTVPIVGRTSVSFAIPGTAPMTEAVVLQNSGTDQTLAFATGGDQPGVFIVASQGPAIVSGVPTTADAVATAPGFVTSGGRTTLVAFSVGGAVTLGTMNQGQFGSIDAGNIPSTTLLAMVAAPDGGAALFVSNGTTITRYDIDGSQGISIRQGFTISANPTSGGGGDTPRALVVDGFGNAFRGFGYVGGGTLGDIYRFDAQLDGGDPEPYDVALVSNGRLAPPVTGLALMPGRQSEYLLAANTQGLTVYDLTRLPVDARNGAFILRGSDGTGTITAPGGVAATNLGINPGFPGGAIVVGNIPDRTLAMLSWADVNKTVDGGVVVDPGYDPRNGLFFNPTPDAGQSDGGGTPDAGDGGGRSPSGGGGPPSPGIPIDNSGSCTAAGGMPSLLPLLAVLALAMALRGRRSR